MNSSVNNCSETERNAPPSATPTSTRPPIVQSSKTGLSAKRHSVPPTQIGENEDVRRNSVNQSEPPANPPLLSVPAGHARGDDTHPVNFSHAAGTGQGSSRLPSVGPRTSPMAAAAMVNATAPAVRPTASPNTTSTASHSGIPHTRGTGETVVPMQRRLSKSSVPGASTPVSKEQDNCTVAGTPSSYTTSNAPVGSESRGPRSHTNPSHQSQFASGRGRDDQAVAPTPTFVAMPKVAASPSPRCSQRKFSSDRASDALGSSPAARMGQASSLSAADPNHFERMPRLTPAKGALHVPPGRLAGVSSLPDYYLNGCGASTSPPTTSLAPKKTATTPNPRMQHRPLTQRGSTSLDSSASPPIVPATRVRPRATAPPPVGRPATGTTSGSFRSTTTTDTADDSHLCIESSRHQRESESGPSMVEVEGDALYAMPLESHRRRSSLSIDNTNTNAGALQPVEPQTTVPPIQHTSSLLQRSRIVSLDLEDTSEPTLPTDGLGTSIGPASVDTLPQNPHTRTLPPPPAIQPEHAYSPLAAPHLHHRHASTFANTSSDVSSEQNDARSSREEMAEERPMAPLVHLVSAANRYSESSRDDTSPASSPASAPRMIASRRAANHADRPPHEGTFGSHPHARPLPSQSPAHSISGFFSGPTGSGAGNEVKLERVQPSSARLSPAPSLTVPIKVDATHGDAGSSSQASPLPVPVLSLEARREAKRVRGSSHPLDSPGHLSPIAASSPNSSPGAAANPSAMGRAATTLTLENALYPGENLSAAAVQRAALTEQTFATTLRENVAMFVDSTLAIPPAADLDQRNVSSPRCRPSARCLEATAENPRTYTLLEYVKTKPPPDPERSGASMGREIVLHVFAMVLSSFASIMLLLGLFFWSTELQYSGATQVGDLDVDIPHVGSMRHNAFTLLLGALLALIVVVVLVSGLAYFCVCGPGTRYALFCRSVELSVAVAEQFEKPETFPPAELRQARAGLGLRDKRRRGGLGQTETRTKGIFSTFAVGCTRRPEAEFMDAVEQGNMDVADTKAELPSHIRQVIGEYCRQMGPSSTAVVTTTTTATTTSTTAPPEPAAVAVDVASAPEANLGNREGSTAPTVMTASFAMGNVLEGASLATSFAGNRSFFRATGSPGVRQSVDHASSEAVPADQASPDVPMRLAVLSLAAPANLRTSEMPPDVRRVPTTTDRLMQVALQRASLPPTTMESTLRQRLQRDPSPACSVRGSIAASLRGDAHGMSRALSWSRSMGVWSRASMRTGDGASVAYDDLNISRSQFDESRVLDDASFASHALIASPGAMRGSSVAEYVSLGTLRPHMKHVSAVVCKLVLPPSLVPNDGGGECRHDDEGDRPSSLQPLANVIGIFHAGLAELAKAESGEVLFPQGDGAIVVFNAFLTLHVATLLPKAISTAIKIDHWLTECKRSGEMKLPSACSGSATRDSGRVHPSRRFSQVSWGLGVNLFDAHIGFISYDLKGREVIVPYVLSQGIDDALRLAQLGPVMGTPILSYVQSVQDCRWAPIDVVFNSLLDETGAVIYSVESLPDTHDASSETARENEDKARRDIYDSLCMVLDINNNSLLPAMSLLEPWAKRGHATARKVLRRAQMLLSYYEKGVAQPFLIRVKPHWYPDPERRLADQFVHLFQEEQSQSRSQSPPNTQSPAEETRLSSTGNYDFQPLAPFSPASPLSNAVGHVASPPPDMDELAHSQTRRHLEASLPNSLSTGPGSELPSFLPTAPPPAALSSRGPAQASPSASFYSSDDPVPASAGLRAPTRRRLRVPSADRRNTSSPDAATHAETLAPSSSAPIVHIPRRQPTWSTEVSGVSSVGTVEGAEVASVVRACASSQTKGKRPLSTSGTSEVSEIANIASAVLPEARETVARDGPLTSHPAMTIPRNGTREPHEGAGNVSVLSTFPPLILDGSDHSQSAPESRSQYPDSTMMEEYVAVGEPENAIATRALHFSMHGDLDPSPTTSGLEVTMSSGASRAPMARLSHSAKQGSGHVPSQLSASGHQQQHHRNDDSGTTPIFMLQGLVQFSTNHNSSINLGTPGFLGSSATPPPTTPQDTHRSPPVDTPNTTEKPVEISCSGLGLSDRTHRASSKYFISTQPEMHSVAMELASRSAASVQRKTDPPLVVVLSDNSQKWSPDVAERRSRKRTRRNSVVTVSDGPERADEGTHRGRLEGSGSVKEDSIKCYEIREMPAGGGGAATGDTMPSRRKRNILPGVDRRTGQSVVIKRTPHDARHRREANIMAKLNHQNIIKFIGLDDCHEDCMYLVMECITSGSLGDLLYKFPSNRSDLFFRPLPRQAVKVYTEQLLKALSYLHRHGVVHRDVSINNIMVTSEGVCKLLDFDQSVEVEVDHNVPVSAHERSLSRQFQTPSSWTRTGNVYRRGNSSVVVATQGEEADHVLTTSLGTSPNPNSPLVDALFDAQQQLSAQPFDDPPPRFARLPLVISHSPADRNEDFTSDPSITRYACSSSSAMTPTKRVPPAPPPIETPRTPPLGVRQSEPSLCRREPSVLADLSFAQDMVHDSESERVLDTKQVSFIAGTPVFMSPQACRGEIHRKNDIWSLGMIVFYCLTGTLPYPERYTNDSVDREELVQDIAKGVLFPKLPTSVDPEQFPELDETSLAFVQLCLSADLAKRPTAEQLCLHPFIKT